MVSWRSNLCFLFYRDSAWGSRKAKPLAHIAKTSPAHLTSSLGCGPSSLSDRSG